MPKPNRTKRNASLATMEEVVACLWDAFVNVASNQGAPGPDRQTIAEVALHLDETLTELARSLEDGTYRVGDIRRVWIPKSGGGQRGLGIPNVIDRVVQESVRMVLEPLYEPTFHSSSHGFRPNRSCHTAIAQAVGYVEEGYDIVVDMDLEKFFDRVHHQRLMARLAQRVHDSRLLRLIHCMLKAKVVMPDGVKTSTEEGVPQGGPLSPLLSNIVLDELDRELQGRGHRFVRYADDCNIFVRSQRAGERVMASVTDFIERRMRLKVNSAKSAVARPEERHFLGFSMRREPLDGTVEVLLSTRSKERIEAKIRQATPRNWGASLVQCIVALNAYLSGWIGFFGICTAGVERTLHGLDAHIRRRLRALTLKQWKQRRTIVRNLILRGVQPRTAWSNIYKGRRNLWALSHCPAVDRALNNAHWSQLGLVSLKDRWRERQRILDAPVQLTLPLG
jgi:group II intron reverse transcriptase/maturase